MPNLYSDEANRPRQIEVREKVLSRARTLFMKFRSNYSGIGMEDSFSMCYGTGETAFANPDPGLDPEELSTEKCESDSEDEEEPRLRDSLLDTLRSCGRRALWITHSTPRLGYGGSIGAASMRT